MRSFYTFLYLVTLIISIVFFRKSSKEKKNGVDNSMSKKIAVGNLTAFIMFFLLAGISSPGKERRVEDQFVETSVNEEYVEVAETSENNSISDVDRGMVFDEPITESGPENISDEKDVIPLENIAFEETEQNLYLGDSVLLTVIYLPEDTTEKGVEWKSSDESVLTIDSEGNAIAIQGGESVVTAMAENGLTAECVLTVDASTRIMRISVSKRREDDVNIGNEWIFVDEVNGERVSSGNYILSVGDTLVFHSKYTESDTRPDVGEASATHIVTAEDLLNGFDVTLNINVTENGGRNSGKSARFVVTYTIAAD